MTSITDGILVTLAKAEQATAYISAKLGMRKTTHLQNNGWNQRSIYLFSRL